MWLTAPMQSECYQGQPGDRAAIPARQMSTLRTVKLIQQLPDY